MSKLWLLAPALILLFAPGARAQTIVGKAVDDVTRTPVPLARVSVVNDSGRVLTTRTADSVGTFEIPVPRDDTLHLRVESIGYEASTTPRFALERGELFQIEVRLSARAFPIEPMIVVARRRAPARLQEFFERADRNRKTGVGRIWTREDLERQGVRNVSMLVGMVPRRPAAGCSGSVMLIDDLPIEPYELDLISVEDLEGIEVYRDAMEMPIEYAARGYCHLVLLWRKPYGEGARPLTWRRVLIAAGAAVLFVILAR